MVVSELKNMEHSTSSRCFPTENKVLVGHEKRHFYTRSSAVAERPLDASCLSVVSFNIPTARFFYYQLLRLQIY